MSTSGLVQPSSRSYILKLVGDCNLGCPYCYYFGGSPRISRTRMEWHIIEQFLEQAISKSSVVELIWHGGEPLMVGTKFMSRILDLQEELSQRHGGHFINLIQTNGTLINKEWVDILRRGEFGIGISLDGPKWLHDRTRPYVSGKSSFDQVLQGVKLLKDAGLGFGILAVVTKASLAHAKDIFDYFVSLGVESFDFLPCVEKDSDAEMAERPTLTDESLRLGDFAEFMLNIFEAWLEHGDQKVRVRYLENVLVGLLGGRPSNCTFNGTCGDYVTVNHDGSVLPCDNFIGSPELVFGNLRDHSLDQLLDSNKRKSFQEQVGQKRVECISCEFLHACGGGCSKYSYMWNSNFQDRNYFCGDRWKIFSHVAHRIRMLCPNILINTRSPVYECEEGSSFIATDAIGVKNFDRKDLNSPCNHSTISIITLEHEQKHLSENKHTSMILAQVIERLRRQMSQFQNEWSDSYSAWDRGWDRNSTAHQ